MARREDRPDIIQVRGLKAVYGDKTVLRDIDFAVRAGEVLAILGGSGSGKSTLLKHMIGLHQPAEGSILIDGDDMALADEPTRRRILGKIGVSYQSGALFGSMTVLENLRLPMEEFTMLPREAMDFIACIKLALVDLAGAGHLLPAELSGGMRKRAAIARAMALDPKIVFLDEPSAGLDPSTSAGLDQLILKLRDSLGITFVVVTHELPSIYTIADRVIMLSKETKSIVAQGNPRELRDASDNDLVRRFFRREAEPA